MDLMKLGPILEGPGQLGRGSLRVFPVSELLDLLWPLALDEGRFFPRSLGIGEGLPLEKVLVTMLTLPFS
jgi:hypothetical protein